MRQTPTMRCAIYSRLSKNRTGESVAVERQEADCEALAKVQGWQVVATFRDDGISAWSESSHRKDFERLCEAIARGEVEYVIAYDIDRFARRMDSLLPFLKLLAVNGVTGWTVKNGELATDTSKAKFFTQLQGLLSEFYVNDMQEKALRARADLARRGVRHVTLRPFGWEEGGLKVRESEAVIVREMVSRLIGGESCSAIARDLNQRGITTIYGHVWSGIAVKNTATRPSNAALRDHRGSEYQGTWEPIISIEDYRTLQAIMRIPKTSIKRTFGRKYVLSGLAYCGVCGSKLTVRPATSRNYATYRCNPRLSHVVAHTGCGKVSRYIVPVDHLVREAVIYRLNGPGLVDAINQQDSTSEDVRALITEAEQQRAKIEQLTLEYATTSLWTPVEFKKAKMYADGRLRAIEADIASQSVTRGIASMSLGDDIRAWFETASVDQQWRLFDLLIERVVVNPQAQKSGFKVTWYEVDGVKLKFDPELIEIIWRA